MDATPDTIVLIHGFWVTPRSWEDWKARYESRGYRVLTPAYPGFEVEVEALNAARRPSRPYGAGGRRASGVCRLADRAGADPDGSFGRWRLHAAADGSGYGAAGVAINSAPTEGVKRVPLSQIRSSFPVLKNPANRHKAVGFTFEQWRYAFTNTFREEEARRLYERYHIPASGRVFWAVRSRTSIRGPTTRTWTTRTPTGRRCSSSLAARITSCPRRSSARTRSTTRRRARSPRSPSTRAARTSCPPRGWEEIADYALDWAIEHAQAPATVSGTATQ